MGVSTRIDRLDVGGGDVHHFSGAAGGRLGLSLHDGDATALTVTTVAKQWFVVHALTGQEERVKSAIEGKIAQGGPGALIAQVIIPMEKVSEVKGGKKKISERKFFPGYVLVEMELTDDSWYLIRNIPGVSGFVGSGQRPVPLAEDEVQAILKAAEEKMEKPIPKVIFDRGESVRITEGPFTNFNGAIEDVNPEKGKLKVMVTIFGRATPVELEYWQVEKI